MNENEFKVYGYRWIVLIVFSIINMVIQINWITFAPITVDCMRVYTMPAFWIVLLSMSFMIIYLFVSVPASYIIDKYGIHIGVGIGALLTGVFGYLRGAFASSYAMIAAAQFGLAVAQPFILNAITRVAAEWFPLQERATASGIATLSQFIGIIIAMAATRPIAELYVLPGAQGLDAASIQAMLMIYGYLSVGGAVLFIALAKKQPPTPPCSEIDSGRFGVRKGLQHMFRQRDMLLLLFLFFIGLGMFNAITTFVDLILASKGFAAGGNEAGDVGALMMMAGVLGAIIMPVLSDWFRKRKLFLVLSLTGLVPGLIGLTFSVSYVPLLVSSGVFGFFFMAAAPVGFQYAAEISHPAPESTSQGMIILSGQVSGILFITLMALLGNVGIDALADARAASDAISLQPFMIAFIVLSVANILIGLMMKESPLISSVKKQR